MNAKHPRKLADRVIKACVRETGTRGLALSARSTSIKACLDQQAFFAPRRQKPVSPSTQGLLAVTC
jgi:hypothetical protein